MPPGFGTWGTRLRLVASQVSLAISRNEHPSRDDSVANIPPATSKLPNAVHREPTYFLKTLSAENNTMSDYTQDADRLEREREMIVEARKRGTGPKLWAYTKLSGPGWLQSAITLGGGSLAGSLYLGVLGGYSLMWLQPLAMILGIIMLSAIGYVALSTQERPFQAINQHINPVLGWAWAIATMMANLVWCMPQFALGTDAIRNNLATDVLGKGVMADTPAKIICVALLFTIGATVVWFYDSGAKGVKIFEGLLKAMVGIVVVSFFGVVIKMSLSGDGLPWNEILSGFIPNPQLLFEPAATFREPLAATKDFSAYWHGIIMNDQRDVMITAAATAVGINMTFLLPYSMLKRGWDKDFRGLAIFDLSTGLFVPFLLATSCVVIASATQFHVDPDPGLLGVEGAEDPGVGARNAFNKLLDGRLIKERGADAVANMSDEEKAAAREALPQADREVAAMLIRRDAFDLAKSLRPLTGEGVAQYVFGIGVVGMAISTIIILMLINGFVVCEMLGQPSSGAVHRAGCFLAGIVGAAGPFIWGSQEAQFWLAVPTSVFGFVLLPIAYITFFLMMNSKQLLGDKRPTGGKRIWWNTIMGLAVSLALLGSVWTIWNRNPPVNYIGLGILVVFALIVFLGRRKEPVESAESAD